MSIKHKIEVVLILESNEQNISQDIEKPYKTNNRSIINLSD